MTGPQGTDSWHGKRTPAHRERNSNARGRGCDDLGTTNSGSGSGLCTGELARGRGPGSSETPHSNLGISVSGHSTGEAARGKGWGDSAAPCIGLGATASGNKRSAVWVKVFILDYQDDKKANTVEASSICSSHGESEGESSGESDDEQEGQCTVEWSAQPPQHWGLED